VNCVRHPKLLVGPGANSSYFCIIEQTWDDWFRVQTEDHSFQDVIDTLLNSAIFLYIGSILPWNEFGGGFFGIQPWRLVVLGVAIMFLRRLPWVVALVSYGRTILPIARLTRRWLQHRWIPTLPTWKESAFAGFFGPIGVGAVFYVQVALEHLPEERERLRA
jgi:NhaP-type Na+/H+ or K+/H+ antiporter